MRKRVDTALLISVASLVLFGVVMVYSSSIIIGFTKMQDAQFFFRRDLLYAVAGLVACAVAANMEYQTWQRLAKWMLPATFVLLVSVFIFSRGEINGAHRWIELGGISFQPSELAKLTFIMYLAAWFTQRKEQIDDFRATFWPFLGVLVGVGVLMLMQPDFGTLTVMVVAALAIFWVAGMTWKQAAVGVLVLAVALAGILSSPYRQKRLAAYFGAGDQTTQETSGILYHVENISIAIGSGGWLGLGFNESRQKRLFLPEPHTDSIFAVAVEELGFIISTLLIAVFVFVLYRAYRIAILAPDSYSRYLATGIATWFAYQAFLNLAAMLQLVPLKGIPLPFVSYGGTNLIVSLFAMGVLLNISRYIKTPEHYEKPHSSRRPARRVPRHA